MKWERVDLVRFNTQADALGNEVETTPEVLCSTKGRMTPWTADELLMRTYDEQRTVTRDQQRFMLLKFNGQAEYLKVADIYYPIIEIQKLGRYVLVTVDKFKVRHEF